MRVRNALPETCDPVLLAHRLFECGERPVASPEQALRPGMLEQRPCALLPHVRRFEAIPGRELHPRSAVIDRAEHRLETLRLHALPRRGMPEVVDHELH